MSRRRPAYVHQWTQEQRIWLMARAHLPRKALATRRRVTELPAELRDTGFATVRLEHAVFRRQRQLKST